MLNETRATTVITMAVAGVIKQGSYYPMPAAWPTIFSAAALTVVGLNAL